MKNRNKRLPILVVWLLTLLLLCAAAFWRSSGFCLGAAILLLLLSPGTLLIQLAARKSIRLRLTLPESAEKNTAARVELIRDHGLASWLAGCVSLSVEIRNLLTEETAVFPVTIGAFSGKGDECGFSIRSDHCGMLEARVRDIRYYDWLRLFSVKQGKRAVPTKERCMIPPETFPIEIVRDALPVPSHSAEMETLGLPGNDFTEIYSLRGYEPGDDIKRIHWKLTEKTDEVLVREGSRPQEDEVLLYWDRTGHTAPPYADALAECVTSVGLALLQSRLRFVFCLQYPDGYYSSRIDSESAFLEAVGKMLHGREETELRSLQELSQSFIPQTAICFFGGPETPFDLPVQKILSYRCSGNGDITPENYRDALRLLAL